MGWLAAGALALACEDPPAPVPPPPTSLTIDTIVNRSPVTYDHFVGLGERIHVAFQVTAGQVEAQFTPRFDDTFVFRGNIEGDRLVLSPVFDDEMRAAADYNATIRTLSITRLELEAHRVSDDQATFGSRVRFFGTHDENEGDTGWWVMVDGEATLGEDVTPPRARLEQRFIEEGYVSPRRPIGTPGRYQPLPPWEPIVLQFSEPVRPEEVIPAIHVSNGMTSLPFHTIEEPFPVTDLELVPETFWPASPALNVEIASFEDLQGNPSEPVTLEVTGADYEMGTIVGEIAVPTEAGCSPTDDCIALQGGECNQPGVAIVSTGPTVGVRVIAPEYPAPLAPAHVDITQTDLGGAPNHHDLDVPYGSDTGWQTFTLPSSPARQPVLGVDVRPHYCWGLDRFSLPVTVVVRR
jgi:hypothetical protein